MQLEVSPTTAATIEQRAKANGLSVSAYLEALVSEPELWGASNEGGLPDPSGEELIEVREAIAEGLRDADAGKLTSAEDLFASAQT